MIVFFVYLTQKKVYIARWTKPTMLVITNGLSQVFIKGGKSFFHYAEKNVYLCKQI